MVIRIRPQRVSDAKRFFDILSNPNFVYFGANPKTVDEEIVFLRQNTRKRRNKSEFNFSIMNGKELVGGCGIMVRGNMSYLGEIGYFIDEKHWNRGYAAEAVKQIENFALRGTGVCRVEIRIAVGNIASHKVAEKCGYLKEGTLRYALYLKEKWHDCVIYGKIIRAIPPS